MDQSPSSEQKNTAREANEAKVVGLFAQFLKKFPTDSHCYKELFRIGIKENILRCSICGNQPEANIGYRILKCRGCGAPFSLTAGTLFANARKIKAWLGAIWVMERGGILTSSNFHKLARIAQSSALNILRKVRMAIEGNLQTDSEQVSSSLFCFVVNKRSRETPARAHPQEEEEEEEEEESAERAENQQDAPSDTNTHATHTDEQQEAIGKLQEPTKTVFNVLSEEPLSADHLCNLTGLSSQEVGVALMFLELDGLVTRLDGDRYVRKTTEPAQQSRKRYLDLNEQSQKIVDFILTFVYNYFHGTSRKYLQNYASAHWWQTHRHNWQSGKLIKVCLLTEPISYDDIIAYVTPAAVKI